MQRVPPPAALAIRRCGSRLRRLPAGGPSGLLEESTAARRPDLEPGAGCGILSAEMTGRPAPSTVAIVLAAGMLLQGCASSPRRSSAASAPAETAARSAVAHIALGSEIAMRAMSLLGTPYHYGGEAPGGFDCSGLVRFVHHQLGIEVPRTTAEQYSAAAPVGLGRLAPGDLLFFRIKGAHISHVAIYTGEGRFIHAPQTGRTVELSTLDDAYYRPRLAAAGRFF